jgi:hypothetical protein
MNPIRIRTTVTSDTLHLPEIQPFVGRAVEITVREDVPADDVRAEFYAELGRIPETREAFAAQTERFRVWRADPRFEAYWPALDHLVARDFDWLRQHASRLAAVEDALDEIRAEGGIDEDALRAQDECDLRHANDHIQ